MTIQEIKATISRENKAVNKPEKINQLRAALFDQSPIKNAILTIITFGHWYRSTLKNEATKLYKQTRREQKVEHFPALAGRIKALKAEKLPYNAQTPRQALVHILDKLKAEGYANKYSDNMLLGAILSVTASANLSEVVPQASWDALKRNIIDTSNGRSSAYSAAVNRKIGMLPRFFQEFASLARKRIPQNQLAAELKKIPAIATCYCDREIAAILANHEAFERFPLENREQLWHQRVGTSSELRQDAGSAYETLLNNFSFTPAEIKFLKNRNGGTSEVTLGDLSSPDFLLVYQDEFPYIKAEMKISTLPALFTAINAARADTIVDINEELELGGYIDLTNCDPSSAEAAELYVASVDKYMTGNTTPTAPKSVKDLVRTDVQKKLTTVPNMLLHGTLRRVKTANPNFGILYSDAELKKIIQAPDAFTALSASNPRGEAAIGAWAETVVDASPANSNAEKLIKEVNLKRTMVGTFNAINDQITYATHLSNERLNVEWHHFSPAGLADINLSAPGTILIDMPDYQNGVVSELAPTAVVTSPNFMADFPRVRTDITFENAPEALLEKTLKPGTTSLTIEHVSATKPDGSPKPNETYELEEKARYAKMIRFLSRLDSAQGPSDHSLIQNVQVMLTQAFKSDLFKPISVALMSSNSLENAMATLDDESNSFRINSPSRIHQTCKQPGRFINLNEIDPATQKPKELGIFEYTVELDHVLDETGTWVVRNVRMTDCQVKLN